MTAWTIKELAPVGRVRRLRLTGEVDATAARGLTEALAAAGRPQDHVVLDVTGVSRLTAPGLRAIARDDHERAVRGGSLSLTGTSPQLQRELAQAGLLALARGPRPRAATA